MNASKPYVVLSTAANTSQARDLAKALVERGLAACVSIIPGVESIYQWQGAIEESSEVMMLIKTTEALSPTLTAELAELHPYETPEILALPVADGFQPYLGWIAEVTSNKTP